MFDETALTHPLRNCWRRQLTHPGRLARAKLYRDVCMANASHCSIRQPQLDQSPIPKPWPYVYAVFRPRSQSGAIDWKPNLSHVLHFTGRVAFCVMLWHRVPAWQAVACRGAPTPTPARKSWRDPQSARAAHQRVDSRKAAVKRSAVSLARRLVTRPTQRRSCEHTGLASSQGTGN